MKIAAWFACAALCWALVCAPGARAFPYFIGLFADAGCTTCNLEVPFGSVGTFYVRAAVAAGADALGGAEFRVVGLPPAWVVLSVVRSPQAAAVIGDPLQGGTDIAFPTGMYGQCIDLFTIQIAATTVVSDVVLQVTKHSNPPNPAFQCPSIFPDCAPCFAQICVDGGSMFVNSSQTCTVATARSTWSQVKRLYD